MQFQKLTRKLHLLADFLAVVDEGGIRQAAEKIHLSQPALTRRIQDLEETLGVSLFERRARGMELTQFGEILLHHARSISLSSAYATREIADLLDGVSGDLRIAAGTAWAHTLIPDALAKMYSRFPNVRITLHTQMSDGMTLLANGNLEAVVGAGDHLQDEVVRFEPMLRIQTHIFCSASHPLANKRNVGPQQLAEHPWVWLGDTQLLRPIVENFFSSARIKPPNYSVSTASVPAGIRLVQQTQHLIPLPWTLGRLAHQSGLSLIPLASQLQEYSAGLIYREGVTRLRAFSAFRECLLEAIAELGLPPASLTA